MLEPAAEWCDDISSAITAVIFFLKPDLCTVIITLAISLRSGGESSIFNRKSNTTGTNSSVSFKPRSRLIESLILFGVTV